MQATRKKFIELLLRLDHLETVESQGYFYINKFEMDKSIWVTAAQAMQYLNVGRTKLWQLRINSELKYAVHGRKVYILKKSMDEYIERYSVGSLLELKSNGGWNANMANLNKKGEE